MLKYTTGEDGSFSPHQHNEKLIRNIHLSASSKPDPKMAIKKRGGKRLPRGADPPHLPPIQSGSPHGLNLSHDRHESSHLSPQVSRKEMRTPYVAHVGINRMTDVATPYIMHTQITKIDRASPLARETSKLSNNVVEVKTSDHPELRHEPTFSSLNKFPNNASPTFEKRPRGRYGRASRGFFEDNDTTQKLQIQSSQAGLYHRQKKEKNRSRGGAGDESFSIRKKIEQFRRWHEEQYTEKLKKLKQEVDHQYIIEQNRGTHQQSSRLSKKSTSTTKNDNRNADIPEEVEKASSYKSHEKMDVEKEDSRANVSATTDTKARTESARTWHTWRDANESYAYTDVKKYIKDNELMDPEKELWIKKWVMDVNKAMKDEKFEGFL